MDARAFGSATQLAVEIRDRRIGCLELLDFHLARAERYNPALNAIIAWQIDVARQRARDADTALVKGEVWGPLHGIPMTVKESFNVAGLPTTFGNPLWKDNIAASNAVVVDRLLQAGAIVFGKTNVPYMLMDSQSYNDIHGTTNNPWDISRGPAARRVVRPRCWLPGSPPWARAATSPAPCAIQLITAAFMAISRAGA
jgi:amidase